MPSSRAQPLHGSASWTQRCQPAASKHPTHPSGNEHWFHSGGQFAPPTLEQAGAGEMETERRYSPAKFLKGRQTTGNQPPFAP